MARVVRLAVVTGPHKGQKFCFCGNARCLIGRSPTCTVQLDGDQSDRAISREHCLLTVDSTSVTLQDMHSRNGTYLNGERIATAHFTLPGDDPLTSTDDFCQCSLLTLGGTTLRIDVVKCPSEDTASGEQPIVWEEGENLKKLCPVNCG